MGRAWFMLTATGVLTASLTFAVGAAEEAPAEPDLYQHYESMQQLQQRILSLPLDKQERLQPLLRDAERQACRRLHQEQREGASVEAYRRQGGDSFAAFTGQFDRYCQTLP